MIYCKQCPRSVVDLKERKTEYQVQVAFSFLIAPYGELLQAIENLPKKRKCSVIECLVCLSVLSMLLEQKKMLFSTQEMCYYCSGGE